MEEEDRQKLTDLVKELVLRLLDTDPSTQLFQSSFLYSLRILSSRLLSSPSLLDPISLSDSIKRRLASRGKSSLALSFHDLFSRFSSLSGPGSVNNKPSLLLLLHIISLDQNDRSGLDNAAAPAVITLPSLLDPFEGFYSRRQGDRARVPGERGRIDNGVLLIEKDPENLRDLACREYVDLVREEFDVHEEVFSPGCVVFLPWDRW